MAAGFPFPEAPTSAARSGAPGNSAYRQPTIDPRLLGRDSEALHSHPPFKSPAVLPNGEYRSRPHEIEEGLKALKGRHRKAVVYPNSDDVRQSQAFIRMPLEGKDVNTKDRRQGQIYGDRSAFEELPTLESFACPSTEEEASSISVPIIQVLPPTPASGPPDVAESKKLSVDHAYQHLYHKSQKEIRRLKSQCKGLEPLAHLVAQAEGLGACDFLTLVEALQEIIRDRERLSNLLPLALTLAADKNVDAEDPQAMMAALESIMDERTRAIAAARHYKQRARTLAQELIAREEDEQYIR